MSPYQQTRLFIPAVIEGCKLNRDSTRIDRHQSGLATPALREGASGRVMCPAANRHEWPSATRGSRCRGRAAVTTPTFSVEVISLPVSDIERALRFYVDQVGFTLDVDYSPNDAFRVVELTPPGSNCSIQIGNGLTDAPAGSVRNVYLVVANLEAARKRLLERGVGVSDIRHKMPVGAWDRTFAPGLDPARGDYASFANFSEPDGNSWVLQERGYRNV
jgi:predicted enzyme related to lactoylglutathione lyase